MILEELGQFSGYELLDSGEGYRLERFGEHVLSRPDPAVLWKKALPEADWQKASAVFLKKNTSRQGIDSKDEHEEKGNWKIANVEILPDKWLMHYLPNTPLQISFYARLAPFKHTGVFPEQAANWDFIVGQAKKYSVKMQAPIKVLNLFGYTGIASVLCAKLGWQVTHVDASKPSISWAKENMLASGLPDNAIRWILDDALKFVKREARRGAKYDAVIMDPPAFGRGAKGEVWKFNEDLPKLMTELQHIIAQDFKFMIVNAYAVSVSSLLLKNLLQDFAENIGIKNSVVDYGELVLKQKSDPKRLLSTGIFARLHAE